MKHGYGSAGRPRPYRGRRRPPRSRPGAVSERAYARGQDQVGTLGSGNHFLEIQVVDEIFDREAAAAYGLRKGQITVMVHCGSRGFGYQVCEDYLESMAAASRRYDIDLPDRQLACAPVASPRRPRVPGGHGLRRQLRLGQPADDHAPHRAGPSPRPAHFAQGPRPPACLRRGPQHRQAGDPRGRRHGSRRCVHRKGATRAFGPGRPEVPADYRTVGQPVLIPGDMGTASFVCKGTAQRHGGRPSAPPATAREGCMSRSQALKQAKGSAIDTGLEAGGIGPFTGAQDPGRRDARGLQGRGASGRRHGRRGNLTQGGAATPAGGGQGLGRAVAGESTAQSARTDVFACRVARPSATAARPPGGDAPLPARAATR